MHSEGAKISVVHKHETPQHMGSGQNLTICERTPTFLTRGEHIHPVAPRKCTTGTARSISATRGGSTLLGPARGFNRNQHIVLESLRGVLDDGLDILYGEFRVCLNNLGMRHPVGQ